MGSARWECETFLEADPDAVYAWMTDFTEDDHNSAAYKRGAARSRSEGADATAGASSGVDATKKAKPSRREIVSREGNVLRIKDTWDGQTWSQTVTLDPAARSVRIEGGFGYQATWRATPEREGTRLSVSGQMGRGLLGSVVKLFEARTQKSMQKDFDGHVEDLRQTLRDAGKLK